MKLNQAQILEIDRFLQFLGVKFMDVRLELIDHLASEFENDSKYVLLGDFLRTKGNFVRSYQKNLHNKRHWGHQKALFKQTLQFFTDPRYLCISILLGAVIYLAFHVLDKNILPGLFIGTLAVPQIVAYYVYLRPKGMYKKIQSAQYLMSIMSLPSLFLYTNGIYMDWLKKHPTYFMVFWFFVIIFNAAGVLEVLRSKKRIVKQYRNLIYN